MSVTFFYIVEPPHYASLSVPLLCSIRKYCAEPVDVIGYCPEEAMGDLPPAVTEFHHRMDAEIRPLKTAGMWKTPYPHGNKMLAALAERDTPLGYWLDTDVVFIRPFSAAEYAMDGQITCSPAASIAWGGDPEWDRIYAHLGMDLPDYRINLLRRRKKHTFVPYFSAGMIGFPEVLPSGQRFGELWYDLGLKIDEMDSLNGKQRPYLDQMSLPTAIQASGLAWNELDEPHQYILGGRIRGKPLPDYDITAIHYRRPELLSEVGRTEFLRGMMSEFLSEDEMRALLIDPFWFQ